MSEQNDDASERLEAFRQTMQESDTALAVIAKLNEGIIGSARYATAIDNISD